MKRSQTKIRMASRPKGRWVSGVAVLGFVACTSLITVWYLSWNMLNAGGGHGDTRVFYDPFIASSLPSLPLIFNPIVDAELLRSKNSTSSYQIANGTRYALVHVGKTAGSKIGCEVLDNARELSCKRDSDSPPAGYSLRRQRLQRRSRSPLSRASVCRLHLNSTLPMKECQENSFNTFLFTLRNPLDRMVSAFYYERQRFDRGRTKICKSRLSLSCKCRLYAVGDVPGCFLNVDEFAKSAAAVPVEPSLNNSASKRKQRDCQMLAFDVATGKEPCNRHNSFNYEYYVHLTREFKEGSAMYPILVIRQEHVVEDWDKLEAAFGGSGHETDTYRLGSDIFSKKVNNRDDNKFDNLSDIGRENLCLALCRDIQFYKYILYQAQNLNELQTRQSILEVMDVCPEESFHIRDCSPETEGIIWSNIYKNSTFNIKEVVTNSS